MEAVLNLLTYPKVFHGFIHEPIPLKLEFMGRPILTMAIEACVHLNAKRIHILASKKNMDYYHVISELGCWGDLIHYLPIEEYKHFVKKTDESKFLVASPFSLPRFDRHQQLIESLFKNNLETKLTSRSAFTGWSIIQLENLIEYSTQPTAYPIGSALELPFHFIVNGFQSYYDAHFHALREPTTAVYFPPTASNIEDHIWVSHQSGVAPSAEIRENVFIGVGCRIEPYAKIGPNCVIANHCIVGAHTEVKNCILESSAYIGNHLKISDSIVGRHLIYSLKDKISIPIQDQLIISRWKPLSLRALAKKILERVCGGVLFLLFSPLLLLCLILFPLRKTLTVVFPAPMHPSLWRYYRWLSFVFPRPLNNLRWLADLPNLVHVVMGYCKLTGKRRLAISQIKKFYKKREYESFGDRVGLFSWRG